MRKDFNQIEEPKSGYHDELEDQIVATKENQNYGIKLLQVGRKIL